MSYAVLSELTYPEPRRCDSETHEKLLASAESETLVVCQKCGKYCGYRTQEQSQ